MNVNDIYAEIEEISKFLDEVIENDNPQEVELAELSYHSGELAECLKSDISDFLVNLKKLTEGNAVEWVVDKWPKGMTATDKIATAERVSNENDLKRYMDLGFKMIPRFNVPPSLIPKGWQLISDVERDEYEGIYEKVSNAWFWTGINDEDKLDSLSCDVLISAEDLRELISKGKTSLKEKHYNRCWYGCWSK